MTRADRTRRRQAQRDQALQALQAQSALDLQALDDGQRWMLFAACNLLAWLGPVPALRRVVACLFCHCGLGLKLQQVAQVLKLSPRSLSALRKTSPPDLLHALRHPRPGQTPKLLPQHVGPLARFLGDHPGAPLRDVLEFLRTGLGVSVQRHTLQRFLVRYSLGVLQQDAVTDRPLFADPPASAAPLS